MGLEKGDVPDDVDDMAGLDCGHFFGGEVSDHLHDFFGVVGKGLLLVGEVGGKGLTELNNSEYFCDIIH